MDMNSVDNFLYLLQLLAHGGNTFTTTDAYSYRMLRYFYDDSVLRGMDRLLLRRLIKNDSHHSKTNYLLSNFIAYSFYGSYRAIDPVIFSTVMLSRREYVYSESLFCYSMGSGLWDSDHLFNLVNAAVMYNYYPETIINDHRVVNYILMLPRPYIRYNFYRNWGLV